MNQSSSHSQANQIELLPNPGKASDYPLWKLVATSLVTGLVIVSYILAIHMFDKERVKEDPLELAAKLAAAELVKVNVLHSGFGPIGLCDTYEEPNSYDCGNTRIRSLNSVKASIRACAILCRDLALSPLLALIEKDTVELENLETELVAKAWSAVSNSSEDRQTNPTIHLKVEAFLRKNLDRDLRLKDMKVILGRYGKSSGGPTRITAPKSDADSDFVASGFYRENIDVPVVNGHNFRFHRIGTEISTIDASQFHAIAAGMEPSAVLIEVTLESLSDGIAKNRYVKRACALLGSPPVKTEPSCLVLRFPHGLSRQFACLEDFLQPARFAQKGRWKMASNGPVPGNGRLSNSDSLTNMLPCHALSIALYHWLRDIDPPIEPTNARAIFISRFKTERLEKLPNSLAVNSCLVKDTGARERVFLSSFEPGSSGQKALRQCFEYQGVLTQYPASAFPLLINEEGRATMAGRTTYDEDLIRSYLNAIHNTNLAAFDTMATARIFKRRADVEISFLSRRIDLARERLESMKRHQIQDQPLYKRLATQLAIGDTRRNQLRTGRLRAVAAGLNANRSAARAYELASSNFSLCRNGLHRIDGPVERYLIGKELVFSPILTPASEDDFLTEPQSSEQSVWLQKNLNIAEPLSKAFKNASKVKIESMPLDMVLAEHKASLKIHPTTIIFDSRDLESKTPVPGHIASIYPFANLPVPEAQLFYYAKHAHVSGNDDKSSDEQSPPIAWSAIIRDCVFHKDGKGQGMPLSTLETRWHESFSPPLGSCPTMAVEFQLRRPLPEITDMPFDTFVKDPVYKRQAPLIPPIPAQMM